MINLIVLWTSLLFYTTARHWTPEDMNTVNLIKYYGYTVETHEVRTEDGYLLRMHRIPHNRHSNVLGRPVFLQHGLNCASDILVIRSPDKDLVYLLSDSGYDVWLGNSRGNPYSPGYVNAFDNTFWDFSFHEMGIYDLSAEIDYILRMTNHTSLSYIGHSLGGAIAFVLISERPEYNTKINAIIGLAPSVYTSESWFLNTTFTKIVTYIAPILYPLMSRIIFFCHGKDMRTESKIKSAFDECGENSVKRKSCVKKFMTSAITNAEQFEEEYILPVNILTKCGTSMKTLMHICQNTISNDFNKFDYGNDGNLDNYGTPYPPKYNFQSVTTPVALYVAPHDEVVSIECSKRLGRQFKNLSRFYIVNNTKFNHRDFIFAKDAKTLVYYDVLEFLRDCIYKDSRCLLSSEERQKMNIQFTSI